MDSTPSNFAQRLNDPEESLFCAVFGCSRKRKNGYKYCSQHVRSALDKLERRSTRDNTQRIQEELRLQKRLENAIEAKRKAINDARIITAKTPKLFEEAKRLENELSTITQSSFSGQLQLANDLVGTGTTNSFVGQSNTSHVNTSVNTAQRVNEHEEDNVDSHDTSEEQMSNMLKRVRNNSTGNNLLSEEAMTTLFTEFLKSPIGQKIARDALQVSDDEESEGEDLGDNGEEDYKDLVEGRGEKDDPDFISKDREGEEEQPLNAADKALEVAEKKINKMLENEEQRAIREAEDAHMVTQPMEIDGETAEAQYEDAIEGEGPENLPPTRGRGRARGGVSARGRGRGRGAKKTTQTQPK